MRLTVVGCSGSMAGPQSPASSYLVAADDADGRTWTVLLDLGSGAFGPLQSHVEPVSLDAVAITHLHPDHYIDLCGLYVYLRYHPEHGQDARGECRRMPVRGPAGTDERVGVAFGLGAAERLCCFDLGTWEQPWQVGPLTIEPYAVDHPVEAYALRITGPSEAGDRDVTITYSGDTDVCDNIVDAARDADLFLVEAAFQEDRDEARGIHLTGRRAGEVATASGARRIVLTHLQPWTDPAVILDEARSAYAGPAELARPGETYAV